MKFKRTASDGWYCFIDDLGNKGQSFTKKNQPGLYQEMLAWIAEGNEIEPEFTPEELAEKEKAAFDQAIENQRQICKTYLKDSDYKLLEDFDHPEDLPNIKSDRKEWKRILKSDVLENIPSPSY